MIGPAGRRDNEAHERSGHQSELPAGPAVPGHPGVQPDQAGPGRGPGQHQGLVQGGPAEGQRPQRQPRPLSPAPGLQGTRLRHGRASQQFRSSNGQSALVQALTDSRLLLDDARLAKCFAMIKIETRFW